MYFELTNLLTLITVSNCYSDYSGIDNDESNPHRMELIGEDPSKLTDALQQHTGKFLSLAQEIDQQGVLNHPFSSDQLAQSIMAEQVQNNPNANTLAFNTHKPITSYNLEMKDILINALRSNLNPSVADDEAGQSDRDNMNKFVDNIKKPYFEGKAFDMKDIENYQDIQDDTNAVKDIVQDVYRHGSEINDDKVVTQSGNVYVPIIPAANNAIQYVATPKFRIAHDKDNQRILTANTNSKTNQTREKSSTNPVSPKEIIIETNNAPEMSSNSSYNDRNRIVKEDSVGPDMTYLKYVKDMFEQIRPDNVSSTVKNIEESETNLYSQYTSSPDVLSKTTKSINVLYSSNENLKMPDLFQNTDNFTEAPLMLEKMFKQTKLQCPEDEQPWNIGPYEVPTQRDLVLFTKDTLTRMLGSYRKKTMLLLKDIKEASKAAAVTRENNCPRGNKKTFKICVRNVKRQTEHLTKKLIIALEKKTNDVLNFTEVRKKND